MVEGWQRPHALEFAGADMDHACAIGVVEMRDDVIGHFARNLPGLVLRGETYRRAPRLNRGGKPHRGRRRAMQKFDSDGVEIAYVEEGEGDVVVLVHGFASNSGVNWLHTGWLKTLAASGRRAVAIDNRGHGASGKPRDPRDYRPAVMAEDIRALLDHLGVARADILGYSMGARIAAFFALAHPDRVRRIVLGGLGMGLVKGVGEAEPIAAALEAPDASGIQGEMPKRFRAFAEQTGGDLEALAACMRGSREVLSEGEIAGIEAPVLVAVGSKDDIAGRADALAALIPGAEAFEIEGRDHMQAVGDKTFKAKVVAFLDEAGGHG